MADLPAGASELRAASVMALARRNRREAKERLRALGPEALAGLCSELRASVRNDFLMLLDRPEEVVPLLPEADLAISIRSGGMTDAAWLLELATAEQRRACLDLDVWSRDEIELERVREWIDALVEAGRPTLVKGMQELDPELWILAIKDMADVVVVGKEDEPPDGYFTEDGVVYFGPKSDADFARMKEIAQTAFSESQAHYWQFTYGTLFEFTAETEEYALRWRTSRLADLGFPDLDQAMWVYRPLDLHDVAPIAERPISESAGELAVMQDMPAAIEGTLVAEALAKLPAGRAADVVGYILAVANSVAVADRQRLSEPDSVPAALAKAVRGIEIGLRELSRARDVAPDVVLDTTRPLDLFRIGATLDKELRRPGSATSTEATGDSAEGELES